MRPQPSQTLHPPPNLRYRAPRPRQPHHPRLRLLPPLRLQLRLPPRRLHQSLWLARPPRRNQIHVRPRPRFPSSIFQNKWAVPARRRRALFPHSHQSCTQIWSTSRNSAEKWRQSTESPSLLLSQSNRIPLRCPNRRLNNPPRSLRLRPPRSRPRRPLLFLRPPLRSWIFLYHLRQPSALQSRSRNDAHAY